MESDFNGSSSSNNIDKEEVLKSAKVKMGKVKEENERLKKLLAQVVMDYKSLENQILSMAQSKERKSSDNYKENDYQDPELVSLTLGRSISTEKYDDNSMRNKIRKLDGGLKLGLDCKVEHYQATNVDDSMKNLIQDKDNIGKMKEKDTIETQSLSRNLISKEKEISREGNEEYLHETQVKKTRVCIRSRCDTPTMSDGCQWRKYGQKIAKGNPCPRAYYRCTISSTCPVRKQVQRCVDDMSILITTYEGTHNHPLPFSATAIASATSAAATMLKTASSTSHEPLTGPTSHPSIASTSSFGLHTSTLINPFSPNPNPNPRVTISNPSMISSSSHSHPTITLDLTTPNPTTLSQPFNNTWLSSSSNFLNFSSSSTSNSLDFSSWASGYFNSGNLYNNNINNNSPRILHQNINPSNKNNNNSQVQSLNETIAAVATKAIASNPTFQSVLAATISSYVGNNKDSNAKKKSPSPSPSPSEG